MYASPLLQDRLDAAKRRLSSTLRIEYLDREWTQQLLETHGLLKRGRMEAEMALVLVGQEHASHLLFMQMNMNQFYIGSRGQTLPCSIRGIVLNHYTPLNRASQFSGKVKAALTAARKLAMYWWVLRPGKVEQIFILNDPKAAEFLNRCLRKHAFLSIPDPIPDYLKAIEPPHELSKSEKTTFLLTGSMAPRKGCLELFDALRLLPDSIHQVIQVRLLGRFRTDAYRQDVEKAAGQLLQDCPKLELELRPEYLSNTEFANALNTCDYVLAPYLEFYGSSGILGQAARVGKPVLSCRDGLLGEIVSERGLGATFDPSNAGEFSRAIQSSVAGEVYFDPDSAKDYVAQQSTEEFCQAITKIYE